MSKQDEIIEVLKKHEKIVDEWGSNAVFPPYINVATEIETLFEVEGKVEYWVQFYSIPKSNFIDSPGDRRLTLKGVRDLKKDLKKQYPSTKFHVVKRTTVTTDQIIKE